MSTVIIADSGTVATAGIGVNGHPSHEPSPVSAGHVNDDPRIYVRVLNHVRTLIADGTLAPGSPTPTITSLCRTFACTRQTAGKALKLLADDGELRRYPGLGYHVR